MNLARVLDMVNHPIKTSASILVHYAGGLDPSIIQVGETGNILLRLSDGLEAPIVLCDTAEALMDLLARMTAVVNEQRNRDVDETECGYCGDEIVKDRNDVWYHAFTSRRHKATPWKPTLEEAQ
jgi:hypothetical protein